MGFPRIELRLSYFPPQCFSAPKRYISLRRQPEQQVTSDTIVRWEVELLNSEQKVFRCYPHLVVDPFCGPIKFFCAFKRFHFIIKLKTCLPVFHLNLLQVNFAQFVVTG